MKRWITEGRFLRLKIWENLPNSSKKPIKNKSRTYILHSSRGVSIRSCVQKSRQSFRLYLDGMWSFNQGLNIYFILIIMMSTTNLKLIITDQHSTRHICHKAQQNTAAVGSQTQFSYSQIGRPGSITLLINILNSACLFCFVLTETTTFKGIWKKKLCICI